MPSLLLTVFLLQLAIHLVNTFGASSINTLVRHIGFFFFYFYSVANDVSAVEPV
jgi:hypothetical protein